MTQENWNKVSDKALPKAKLLIKDFKARYKQRDLPKGAEVTRVAPSPTGFMHIGGIYAALISERIAHQKNGIFYLRIEDTDKKREVEGAKKIIVESFKKFGIPVDEGEVELDREEGDYGPYLQSERTEIYQAFVKELVKKGLAYPDFTTQEELEDIAKKQQKEKLRPGYYGKWAVGRNLSPKDILRKIDEGLSYTIRFKSNGNISKKIKFEDIVKGKRELPQNDLDVVLLKSDGTPTYHLAHVVDDYLMRTTLVIRGEEWFNSVPLHLQLFDALDLIPPKYGHISPIQKMDGNSRRKLSKRKDPEASVMFYDEQGYPAEAVKEYLMNLANPGFEDWKKNNPDRTVDDYKFDMAQLSKSSGALFDIVKLNDISRDVIAKMSAEELCENIVNWAKIYNKLLNKNLIDNKDYVLHILNIERDVQGKRKDIVKYSGAEEAIGFFFDEIFKNKKIDKDAINDIPKETIKTAVSLMTEIYDTKMSKEEWLDNLKKISKELGYAGSVKEYKENPDKYKGHLGDIAKIYRVLLVGRNQSPDLYEIMKVMGRERVISRLNNY